MTIYEIKKELLELLAEYDIAESDEERDAVLERIFAVDGDLKDKGENYAHIIANYKAISDGLAYEAKRLQAKKRACDRMIEKLKGNIKDVMETLDIKRMDTHTGYWGIQNNPWSCEVTDLSKVPERFLVPQDPVVDKKAALAEFKESGECFDGLSMTQSRSVRFR